MTLALDSGLALYLLSYTSSLAFSFFRI
jgi:hypothetical protein